MRLKIKKVDEHAIIPTRGTERSAGYDLYACYHDYKTNNETIKMRNDVIIRPHESIMFGTGLAMEIPDNHFGAIYARSGLACKQGLRPSNCVAVIDSDYRGEVKVCLRNDTDIPQRVAMGDRIAQLVIQEYMDLPIVEVDELDETERASGGFGSTGK